MLRSAWHSALTQDLQKGTSCLSAIPVVVAPYHVHSRERKCIGCCSEREGRDTVCCNAFVPLSLHDVKLRSVNTICLGTKLLLCSYNMGKTCSLYQTSTLVSGQAQQILLLGVCGTAGASSLFELLKGHTILSMNILISRCYRRHLESGFSMQKGKSSVCQHVQLPRCNAWLPLQGELRERTSVARSTHMMAADCSRCPQRRT